MKKLLIFSMLLIAVFAVMLYAGKPTTEGGIREGAVTTYYDSIPDTVGTDTINGAAGTEGRYYQTFTDVITLTHWGGQSTAVVIYLQVSNDRSRWMTLDSVHVPDAAVAAIEADSVIAVKDWSTYAKLYRYYRIYNQQRDGGTVFGDSCFVRHDLFYAE